VQFAKQKEGCAELEKPNIEAQNSVSTISANGHHKSRKTLPVSPLQ
jgi:hypothetical protein